MKMMCRCGVDDKTSMLCVGWVVVVGVVVRTCKHESVASRGRSIFFIRDLRTVTSSSERGFSSHQSRDNGTKNHAGRHPRQ